MISHQVPEQISTQECEQCGTRAGGSAWVLTEYGLLCAVCAYRQQEHDERHENFDHLTPSSLGFLSDTE